MHQTTNVPGLMVYGLHGNLSSDTDDTDYEPGKIIEKPKSMKLREKKKKILSSSECSVEEAPTMKPVKRKIRRKKIFSAEKSPRKKIRRFADVMLYSHDMSDTSDSDYAPSGNNLKKTTTKSKLRKSRRKMIKTEEKLQHRGPANNDTWSVLPTEILTQILRFVCVIDCKGVQYVCRCAQVCQNWNYVVSQPITWRCANLAFISGMKCARDELLSELAKTKFQQLEELSLSGWANLTDSGVESVANSCPRLKSLCLANCQKKCFSRISGHALLLLAERCSLTKLNLSNLRIHTSYAKTMTTFIETCGTSLTHLNFSGNISLGSAILTTITENCAGLISLDVSNTSVRHINFFKFQKSCPNLEELYLANLPLEPKTSTNDKFPGFKHLTVCSLARRSSLGWLTDTILLHVLKESSFLTTLDIRGNGVISSTGLHLLSEKLERLYMSRCCLSESVIAIICQLWCGTLWDVDFSWCETYGTNFDILLQCLLKNDRPCSLITHLNIAGTSVSDEGVRYILKVCSNLRSLDLTSCRGVSRGVKRHHTGFLDIGNLRRFYDLAK